MGTPQQKLPPATAIIPHTWACLLKTSLFYPSPRCSAIKNKGALGITVQAEYLTLKILQALPYSVKANCTWSTVSMNEPFDLDRTAERSPGSLALRWRNLWQLQLREQVKETSLNHHHQEEQKILLLKLSISFTMPKSTGLKNLHNQTLN